eukprot:7045633-Prymnesium_polylepis.2
MCGTRAKEVSVTVMAIGKVHQEFCPESQTPPCLTAVAKRVCFVNLAHPVVCFVFAVQLNGCRAVIIDPEQQSPKSLIALQHRHCETWL